MEDTQELNKNAEENVAKEECTDLITTLPTKVQRFIHLYLTGQYSHNKLAQLLEVHPNTIANWLRRKDVKQVIEEMQKLTHEMVGVQLRALTLKAINKLNALIDSPIDGVALQAVKDILDRSGHKAKQEIKIDKTVTTIEEQIRKLADKTIIDADYEIIEDEEENN